MEVNTHFSCDEENARQQTNDDERRERKKYVEEIFLCV
jgi:hypothetical protein